MSCKVMEKAKILAAPKHPFGIVEVAGMTGKKMQKTLYLFVPACGACLLDACLTSPSSC